MKKAPTKLENCYVITCCILLVMVSVAKIIASNGSQKILFLPDPIFGIGFNKLMLSVGIYELMIVLACVLSKHIVHRCMLLTILPIQFLVYRVGLVFVDYHSPCICMGTLTSTLHITEKSADAIAKAILAYILAGNIAILLKIWHRQRRGVLLATR